MPSAAGQVRYFSGGRATPQIQSEGALADFSRRDIGGDEPFLATD
jgi:hypothetical protein